MLDILQHILDGLNVYAPAIQAMGVLIALGYVAWQTRQIGRQIRLASRTATMDYNREMNTLFLHAEITEGLDKTIRDDALGFVVMNGYQAKYRLWKDKLADDRAWYGTKRALKNVGSYPFIQAFWKRQAWQFDADFADEVNKIFDSTRLTSTKQPEP